MQSSVWSPLRYALFRDRWIALVISTLGSWMQDTAGTWLMTSLTTSALLIALMQTAATLPVLLLGLLAGALADIFDRRRLLLFWQSWMLLSALILSALTLAGAIAPEMLLALTFLLSLGAAMGNPAWQAIVPELVPRSELPSAIALNSAGFNLARAVGPALGGLLVAVTGAEVVFLLNAVSFLAVIVVLYLWKREPLYKSVLPAERLVGAMRAGLRYVRHAPLLQATLQQTAIVMTCASAVWALLPLVARQNLHLGAFGYGLLNGCLGLGSVLGAVLLPRVQKHLAVNVLVALASSVFAVTCLTLAYFPSLPLAVIALLSGGMAWISMATSFNIAVQLSVPTWVKARALGTYQMFFLGSIAVGSALWGLLAEYVGISTTLLCAALGLIAGLPVALRYRVTTAKSDDLTPALHWAEPQVAIALQPEDGPVLVTIDYQIDSAQRRTFLSAIHALSAVRRRDGAIRWGIFRDIADATRYLETFVVESWGEHLRQHGRFTIADRALEERVRACLLGQPTVSHMIYAHEPKHEIREIE